MKKIYDKKQKCSIGNNARIDLLKILEREGKKSTLIRCYRKNEFLNKISSIIDFSSYFNSFIENKTKLII